MRMYEEMTADDMDLEEMFEYLMSVGDYEDEQMRRKDDAFTKDSDI